MRRRPGYFGTLLTNLRRHDRGPSRDHRERLAGPHRGGRPGGRAPPLIPTDHRWGSVVVTIDRPERRNAVGLEPLVELRRAIDDARERQLRVLVLTGAGGTFCAGADLTEVESDGFFAALRSV